MEEVIGLMERFRTDSHVFPLDPDAGDETPRPDFRCHTRQAVRKTRWVGLPVPKLLICAES